ncbi:MAG: acyl-CoA thioesterase [Dehalococcoidia bacterium]|nr:MAG: acyl-CoA thioesterase [Dehalococcoidia bacterium]UCG83423.1 MAG: acyl-CoA thioesterase [Dehalococcoidia bacterium]
MDGRTVDHSAVTMSEMILPHHAGRAGYVHGGEILKMMDTAAGVVATRHAHADVVTARIDGVNFYYPIKVGNLVIINAYLTFVGRSTMEVRVEVIRENIIKEEQIQALTAYFVMVALDKQGKPTEVPPLILSSDEERERWEKGKQRYERCKSELMAGDDDYRACREAPAP